MTQLKLYEDLAFEELREEDINILAPIMKNAFDEDAKIHLGQEYGGPPGYDNGSFLRHYAIEDTSSTAYKVSCKGKVIGAVILWINENTNENYLGNLFVEVTAENKGLGKKIWDFIELQYSNTKVWMTDTPIFSLRNHHFYVNKCGFKVIRIEKPMDFKEGSYILEKIMK